METTANYALEDGGVLLLERDGLDKYSLELKINKYVIHPNYLK